MVTAGTSYTLVTSCLNAKAVTFPKRPAAAANPEHAIEAGHTTGKHAVEACNRSAGLDASFKRPALANRPAPAVAARASLHGRPS